MKELDERKFDRICREVEADMQMGGLAETIYQDFAENVCKKYMKKTGVHEMTEALKTVYQRAVKNGIVIKEDLKFSEIEQVREALKKAGFNLIDR